MRAGGFIWLGITGAAAFAVFMIAYEVRHLEEEYGSLTREIATHREAIHVLEAEWSYLNRPERLEVLASEHLGLKPVAGRQMMTIDAVPARAGSPAPGDIGHLVAAKGVEP